MLEDPAAPSCSAPGVTSYLSSEDSKTEDSPPPAETVVLMQWLTIKTHKLSIRYTIACNTLKKISKWILYELCLKVRLRLFYSFIFVNMKMKYFWKNCFKDMTSTRAFETRDSIDFVKYITTKWWILCLDTQLLN